MNTCTMRWQYFRLPKQIVIISLVKKLFTSEPGRFGLQKAFVGSFKKMVISLLTLLYSLPHLFNDFCLPLPPPPPQAGAVCHAQDDNLRTPLMNAAEQGHVPLLQILSRTGVPLDGKVWIWLLSGLQ